MRKISEADIDRFMARTAEIRGTTVDALAGFRGMVVKDVVHGPRGADLARVGGAAGLHRAGEFHDRGCAAAGGHLPDGGIRARPSTTKILGPG